MDDADDDGVNAFRTDRGFKGVITEADGRKGRIRPVHMVQFDVRTHTYRLLV